jgi:ribosome-binding factor A
MSHRREQLAAELRRQIGQILEQGLSDPRVRGLISVTQVTVVPDGHTAIIQVSVLPAEHAELTLHGLRHAARHISGEVGRRIRVRHMPRLDFRLDESLKTQARVLEAIRDAVGDEHSSPLNVSPDDGTTDPQAPPTQDSRP